MTSIPLQILMVEDSENDAVILLEELRAKGFNPAFERVQTAADFLSALKKNSWDAVISDYVMPDFSGPAALKLLRDSGYDLPFICVSGIYGEETAVDMMKAGANDYIVKSNLSRLVPALERELDAARLRRMHKRAEGAMQYLAAIVDSSEDAIYGKTLDSLIVSWNPAAEKIYGYSAEEIIGSSITKLFPHNRRDELLEILSRIRRGDVVGLHETERVHKSGRTFPASITISPIRNSQGEIIGASSITRDITEQKKIQEERERLLERLSEAALHVKTLTGMLPICASCKRIRDDHGYWQRVETYISAHSEAVFTHGICPECVKAYEAKAAMM